MLLAVVIETTGFALVWSTYLYLRMQEATWPPWRWSAPDALIGSISTVVILATALPMLLIAKAAKRMDAGARTQTLSSSSSAYARSRGRSRVGVCRVAGEVGFQCIRL